MDKEKIITIIITIVIFTVFTLCSLCLIHSCHQAIDQAGGLRELVVQEGKTIKSIYKDINDDNYTR